MELLPGSYALKSVTIEKYLFYINEQINTLHDILQFSGEDFASPNAKFQVEMDEDNHDLVHIKASNGKYLMRANPDTNWIVADATTKHRDQDSWSCTLFKPERVVQARPDSHTRKYRFFHVQLKHYIEPCSENSFQALANANQRTHNHNQIVDIIDIETPN